MLKPEVLIPSIAAFIAFLCFLYTYFGPLSSVKADLKEKLGEIAGQLKNINFIELNEFIGKFKLINFDELFHRLNVLEQKWHEIEIRLGTASIPDMAAKIEIFWTAIMPSIKSIIKQPVHSRKDELVDKFPNLSDDELCELRDILQGEMEQLKQTPPTKEGDLNPKMLAYALMTARINTALYDNNKKCERG